MASWLALNDICASLCLFTSQEARGLFGVMGKRNYHDIVNNKWALSALTIVFIGTPL